MVRRCSKIGRRQQPAVERTLNEVQSFAVQGGDTNDQCFLKLNNHLIIYSQNKDYDSHL
jgi:hypothetical protein